MGAVHRLQWPVSLEMVVRIDEVGLQHVGLQHVGFIDKGIHVGFSHNASGHMHLKTVSQADL
jgi:hypothetical protein